MFICIDTSRKPLQVVCVVAWFLLRDCDRMTSLVLGRYDGGPFALMYQSGKVFFLYPNGARSAGYEPRMPTEEAWRNLIGMGCV